MSEAGSPPRRVLVSYSHDSDEHREAVLRLAQRLRTHGIDAWIDQFEPAPAQGWPRWIVEQVHRADYVVLVCTATYRRRFEGREKPGVGRGVSYEGLLASQLLYEGKLDHHTLVPVLLPKSSKDDIPLEVRAGTFHNLPDEFDELVARLTDRLAVVPVPLEPIAEPAPGMPDEPDDESELVSLYEDIVAAIKRRLEPDDEPVPVAVQLPSERRVPVWAMATIGALGLGAMGLGLFALLGDSQTETPEPSEATEAESTKTEPVELAAVNSEPVNSEPVNSEPAKPEPVNSEPVNSEPGVIIPALAPDGDPRCDSSRPPAAPSEPFGQLGDPATGSSCGVVRTILANTPAPLDLVGLTGGQFTMGSPLDEDGRGIDEVQHRVLLQPFSICETEVSQKQYQLVTGESPSDCLYQGCGDDLPVQNVTWHEVAEFMNALTRWDNQNGGGEQLTECYDESTWAWRRECTGYRLPTEAEWEYAVRAGSATPWSSGSEAADICKYANIRPQGVCDDGFETFAPVKTDRLLPNAWGLHGMHGNVWEWVFDGHVDYGTHDVTMPVGEPPPRDDRRVLRGGSFELWPQLERSAKRYSGRAEQGSAYYGIRCARGAIPEVGSIP